MAALYIVLSLLTLFNSIKETIGSQGVSVGSETLDHILSEMVSMRNNMDTKMSSLRQDMDTMDSLIQQVEDFRDINFDPQTPPLSPPTPPPQPSFCTSYTPLSDSWRHIDYIHRGKFPVHCDKTGYARWTTYTNLSTAWYRFMGAAGTKLPTAPAPVGGGPSWNNQICGTNSEAYISSGGNPSLEDGVVTRDVCFEWGRNSCWLNTTVKAVACTDRHGQYIVYQLKPVADCNFAYCAID